MLLTFHVNADQCLNCAKTLRIISECLIGRTDRGIILACRTMAHGNHVQALRILLAVVQAATDELNSRVIVASADAAGNFQVFDK